MVKKLRDEKGRFIAAEPTAETKVTMKPRKPVVTKAKATVVEVPVEVLPKCKSCGNSIIKILFDSRAENPLYLYLCDNPVCNLYRQPQKHEGDKPDNLNIVMA